MAYTSGQGAQAPAAACRRVRWADRVPKLEILLKSVEIIMSEWVNIGPVEDFEVGTAKELVTHGVVLAIFRTEDGFFVMDGVCPHQGGPLGQGTLQGCILTCPWHGWQFDVRDGQSQLTPNVRHPTFETQLREDSLFVRIEAE